MDRCVSRRSVLLAGLATAVSTGGLLAAGRDRATAAPASAARAHRWTVPIYRIEDFLQHRPHSHLPRRSIMLTIDDGPHPTWTPKYLRLLAKHDVPATFCMIGSHVRPNRHLAQEVVDRGHVVANHTWSHDEGLETRPIARLRSEIVRTSEAIHSATGVEPLLFRAPGGNWGPRVLGEVARHRLIPLGWDLDPRDWARPGVEAIESAMLAARRNDIILCHDGGGDRSQTYAALKTVIPALVDRGLHFVTLPV